MPTKQKVPNKKEKTFIENYIRTWNGAWSAREAGYSAKNARQTAHELITKPYIQAFIDGRLKEIRMKTNEIYARLSEQARADISEFIEFVDVPVIDKEGKHVGERQSIRIRQEAFEKMGHLIKSISPTSGGDFKVELYSAQQALELMGKTYSIFAERDEKGNIIQPVVNVYIPDNKR